MWSPSRQLLRGITGAPIDAAPPPHGAPDAFTVDLDWRLRSIERRLEGLIGSTHSAATAHAAPPSWRDEIQRLRNELGEGVADLNDQLGDRLRELRTWQGRVEAEFRLAASNAADALQTSGRLADDGLAVSEATQRKLLDFQSTVQARQDLLEGGIVACRQEIEQIAFRPRSSSPSPALSSSAASDGVQNEDPTLRHEAVLPASAPVTSGNTPMMTSGTQAGVTTDAQNFDEEFGGQIWRLGTAMRRIVQVQREQQRQLLLLAQWQEQYSVDESDGGEGTFSTADLQPPLAPRGHRNSINTSGPIPCIGSAAQHHDASAQTQEIATGASSGLPILPGCGAAAAQRHAAIVELYEELRRLEEGAFARHGQRKQHRQGLHSHGSCRQLACGPVAAQSASPSSCRTRSREVERRCRGRHR